MAHAACSSRLRVNVSWAVGSCSVVVCIVRVLQHIHAYTASREKQKIPRHEAQYPRQDHNEAVNTTHQVKSSSRHQVVNHRLDLPRYQQQSTINSKTKTTEQNRATKPSRRQRQRRFAVAVSRKSDLWFSDFRRPVLHSSSFRISGFSFFPDVHAQTLTQPSS